MSQSLILAVAGHQAAQFGSRSSGTFAGVGGSIGRSEDCDWVLGASGVSRVHAMVRYLNGIYFIEDRSTNGMLLNGAPLVKGEPSALTDGDRLLIDTFEVEVHLGDAGATIPPPDLLAPPTSAAIGADIDPLDFGLSSPMASLPPQPSPNTIPAGAKAAGNYLSGQLIAREARQRGFGEGIALASTGLISEGAGEN